MPSNIKIKKLMKELKKLRKQKIKNKNIKQSQNIKIHIGDEKGTIKKPMSQPQSIIMQSPQPFGIPMPGLSYQPPIPPPGPIIPRQGGFVRENELPPPSNYFTLDDVPGFFNNFNNNPSSRFTSSASDRSFNPNINNLSSSSKTSFKEPEINDKTPAPIPPKTITSVTGTEPDVLDSNGIIAQNNSWVNADTGEISYEPIEYITADETLPENILDTQYIEKQAQIDKQIEDTKVKLKEKEDVKKANEAIRAKKQLEEEQRLMKKEERETRKLIEKEKEAERIANQKPLLNKQLEEYRKQQTEQKRKYNIGLNVIEKKFKSKEEFINDYNNLSQLLKANETNDKKMSKEDLKLYNKVIDTLGGNQQGTIKYTTAKKYFNTEKNKEIYKKYSYIPSKEEETTPKKQPQISTIYDIKTPNIEDRTTSNLATI